MSSINPEVKKLRYILIIALIAACGLYAGFRISNNRLTQNPEESSATGSTGTVDGSVPVPVSLVDWNGMKIEYPSSWVIPSWDERPQTNPRLELLSANQIGGSENYFCVDLMMEPLSSDIYKLQGGTVVMKFGHGLYLYRRDYIAGQADELQAWLTDQSHLSVVPTSAGSLLFARIDYRCVGGDAEVSTLDYQEQEAQPAYYAAVNILKSLASSTSS